MKTIKVEIAFNAEEKKALSNLNDDQRLTLDKMVENAQKDGAEISIGEDSMVVAVDGNDAEKASKMADRLHASLIDILSDKTDETTPETTPSDISLKQIVEEFKEFRNKYPGVGMSLIMINEKERAYTGNIPPTLAAIIAYDAIED